MKQFKSYFQSIQRVISCIKKVGNDNAFSMVFIENALEYRCWKIQQDERLNLRLIEKVLYRRKKYKDEAIVFLTPKDDLVIYMKDNDELWHIYRVTR